jgi:hypothetical protein
MDRAALVLLALVLLDSVSTYLLVQKYPVELEVSPILRQLLMVDKRLVFTWTPVEYLVLLGLYYLNKNVRTKLGVKKRIEYVVIALVALAVALNTIGVVVSYIASILSTIRLFLPA